MRNNLLIIFLVLFFFLLIQKKVSASETDQFYARDAVIRDSSEELNRYYSEQMTIALDKVNNSGEKSACRTVAAKVLSQILGDKNLIDYYKQRDTSKLSSFVRRSPLIDRFPDNSISKGVYRHHSIYNHRPFPLNVVAIARTININNIYIGTDKIGHFSSVGRRYYKHFVENLDEGMSEEEAERKAVREGINEEIKILGYKIGGTFSFADLDANYQGLLFGRNLCEGESPYLLYQKGLWVKNPARPFDIRDYIKPKFDEAYNVSFWANRLWKRMKGDVVRSYCENNVSDSFMSRRAYYQALDVPTKNDFYLAEFLKDNPKFDRSRQLLNSDNIRCPE